MWLLIAIISSVLGSPQLLNKWNLETQSEAPIEPIKPIKPKEPTEEASRPVPSQGQLKATACQQGCYIKCLVNGSVNQPCYNECANLCPASDDPSSLALSAAPTNCGQICFQQCYVNFQMIADCYLPCVDLCVSTSVSSLTELAQQATESQRPAPGNQCEYECFVSSWADSFFYRRTYEACTQRACGQGLTLVDQKVLTGPELCIGKCRKVGKVDPSCYGSCLDKSESQVK